MAISFSDGAWLFWTVSHFETNRRDNRQLLLWAYFVCSLKFEWQGDCHRAFLRVTGVTHRRATGALELPRAQ